MDVMKMSSREIIFLRDFIKIAEEAVEAERVIKEFFGKKAFGIGEKEILVYQTESGGEYYGYGYLTANGKFRYEDNLWGGREYEFKVDAEGIYKMLRSCYLRKNNCEYFDPETFNCSIENIDSYFREFISNFMINEK